MTSQSLSDRLRHEPVRVECPICRHAQRVSFPRGRCDQCGSEIEILEARPAAESRLEELLKSGRLAYVTDVGGDLFAVIANRAFGSGR